MREFKMKWFREKISGVEFKKFTDPDSGDILIKAYRGFFYTHGKTADDFTLEMTRKIETAFPNVTVIQKESGEIWVPFRGGAPTLKQSHWYMNFTLRFYNDDYPDDIQFLGR